MAAFKTKPWGFVKPPAGSQINWGDPISRGLATLFLFNEGGGNIAVDVAKNNNGTLTGGVLRTVGKHGKSVLYDGVDDYVVATNRTSITSTQTSVSMWLNISSFLQIYPRFIEIQDGSSSIQILRDGVSEKIVTKHSQFQTSTNGTQWSTPAAGVWQNIVAVWDSVANTTAFYINGVPQTGAANTNTGIGNQANKTYIGVRSDLNAVTWFNGMIGSVRIYSRALSPNEAKRLYTEPFAGILEPRIRIGLSVNVIDTGSGSGSFNFTAAAGGAKDATGSGSSSFNFTAASVGKADATGSGAANFNFTAAAGGALDATSSGSSSFNFTATGDAILEGTGSGAATFNFTSAAGGAADVAGSGSSSFNFTAAAGGSSDVTGSGSSSFNFTATGQPILEGTGSGSASFNFAAEAGGLADKLGAGSSSFNFTAAAGGSADVTGSGSSSFNFTAAGVGILPGTGSGAASFNFTSAAGGIAEVSGSGSSSFSFSAIAGSNADIAGSGAATFSIAASAVGLADKVGSGSATFSFTAVGHEFTPFVFGTPTCGWYFEDAETVWEFGDC